MSTEAAIFTAIPAGRMPGVTTAMSGPTILRTAAASAAEQTTPPMPACDACSERRSTSVWGSYS